MSLIERRLDGTTNKVAKALTRIRSFEPISMGIMDEPYYVAYSGGKDSDVLRILFELSGVKYDLIHHHTTVDAPETVRYVRSIPKIQIEYPELTMWQLIVKKRIPPTRTIRYCCSYLKERGGEKRLVATGVRWSESVKRKSLRSGVEVLTTNREKKLMLNADNDENRKMFENCSLKGKRVLNPIIDWTDDDVWEFLSYYGCESNPLYQCGYKRIGCIGCPMAGSAKQRWELECYPKYKENYIRAFQRILDMREKEGFSFESWKSGQDVYDWWLRDRKEPEMDENQLSLY